MKTPKNQKATVKVSQAYLTFLEVCTCVLISGSIALSILVQL